ncbi:hypothetical protein HG535_0G04360 [Zygotorulaspora mrakii]|uniref:Anaphase-promoting complex subunit 4 n=1 Tax=Zygotorulaspora mrakii TaxID=42260 RepID=A0A7H9B7S4_ZYGMR|nr:uncharacterized protein HG535_0G04360 [Zygotorulaspora mrakii]QLG74553.1 hypothetical protein HG535_0G04360 [Zygotorulaspora mrakii]
MATNSQTYFSYNPHYALCTKETNKGFVITRLADEAKLATIIVRDLKQIASYQWDYLKGKFLIVFFKDGTARIYNCFAGGKLVSLLRFTSKRVISGIWDRVCLPKRASGAFDHDITKLMPLLIKFGRDSRQTYILPYEPPNNVWRRQSLNEEQEPVIFDTHIVYQEEDGTFIIMFQGECPIAVPRVLPNDDHWFSSSPVPKILTIEHGLYCIFHKDGAAESLDLRPLLESELTISLIDNIITMRQLSKYLRDHLDIINKDLVIPYVEFLTKVCDHDYDIENLNQQLSSLLLIGEVPIELEDWFINAFGEKNLKKWKKLALEAYQKTAQVLTLTFIPACERLLILAERIGGLSKSLQLLETQMIGELSELSTLTTTLQSFLETTLRTIKDVSYQEMLFTVFQEWFSDRVMESINEDYKPKMKLDDQPDIAHKLLKFFESRLKKEDQQEAVNDLAKVNSFDTLLRQVNENLESVLDQNIKPKVLHKIKRGYHYSVFKTTNADNEFLPLDTELLDVTTSPSLPVIVFIASNKSHAPQHTTYSLGSLEKTVPSKTASKQVYLEIPTKINSQINQARVWETFRKEEDIVSREHKNKNVTRTLSVELGFEYCADTNSRDSCDAERDKFKMHYRCIIESSGQLKISHETPQQTENTRLK